MTELYREAAKLLGLYADDSGVTMPSVEWLGLPYEHVALPIYLAHLICEKEGWIVTIDGDRLFRVIDRDDYGVMYCIKSFSDTPDAVIRAFVEKYGKKKVDLTHLLQHKDINSTLNAIVTEMESLSERMEKLEKPEQC